MTDRAEDGPLLSVRDLHVSFGAPGRWLPAVEGVSFDVRPREIYAVVGESGSGKSATALSILGLNRGPRTRHQGQIQFGGQDLLSLDERRLRRVRGAQIAMIFQDALSALNPVQPIGWQIAEMVRLHAPVTRAEAAVLAVRLLGDVGIPSPEQRVRAFPHQFSGGMRQRAMIAMALACDPRLLIADEPTTALDVTIQAQILDLLRHLRDERGAAIILITHDLGVVAEVAQRVSVMYAGRIVEEADCLTLFEAPRHPYTEGLMASIPRVDRARGSGLSSIPGLPPSPLNRPAGCAFAPRCPHRFDACTAVPELLPAAGHRAACWRAEA